MLTFSLNHYARFINKVVNKLPTK